MEYYVYCTYNCNLACAYCSARSVVNTGSNLKNDVSRKIIEFLNTDIGRRNDSENSIVFFGGEPSLVPGTMLDIINGTSSLNIKYSFYTNGTILDSLDLSLLRKFNAVFVSIDGNLETHEKYRGKNTYHKILNNVAQVLKADPHIPLVARLTIEEDVDLYTSVINLLPSFQFIHWQIVNKSKFNFPNLFVEKYIISVTRLFDYWLRNFSEGMVIKIVPFQAIVSALLFPVESQKSFRCGCGSELLIIDIDGNIYNCDENAGLNEKQIGHISETSNEDIPQYKSHLDLFSDCRLCEVSNICLGRCRKMLEQYPQEHVRNYCKMTKGLISYIQEKVPQIQQALEMHSYSKEQIYDKDFLTEEIP